MGAKRKRAALCGASRRVGALCCAFASCVSPPPSNVILNSTKASAAVVQRSTVHNSYYIVLDFTVSLSPFLSVCVYLLCNCSGRRRIISHWHLGPHLLPLRAADKAKERDIKNHNWEGKYKAFLKLHNSPHPSSCRRP